MSISIPPRTYRICSMNWLDPPAEPPSDPAAVAESRMNNEAPELSTLNYWAHRLTPLHDPAPSYTSEGIHDQGSEKTVVFVACNRTGTEEGGSTFPIESIYMSS
jgi:protein N-terminal amidase